MILPKLQQPSLEMIRKVDECCETWNTTTLKYVTVLLTELIRVVKIAQSTQMSICLDH